jgi:hypothetical protein
MDHAHEHPRGPRRWANRLLNAVPETVARPRRAGTAAQSPARAGAALDGADLLDENRVVSPSSSISGRNDAASR